MCLEISQVHPVRLASVLKIACYLLQGEPAHNDDDDDDDDRVASLIAARVRGVRGLTVLSTVFEITLHLPRKIRAVCWIMFRSWFLIQMYGFRTQRDKVSIE